jgi:hypothetical protein
MRQMRRINLGLGLSLCAILFVMTTVSAILGIGLFLGAIAFDTFVNDASDFFIW